jgi:hypothetical protein
MSGPGRGRASAHVLPSGPRRPQGDSCDARTNPGRGSRPLLVHRPAGRRHDHGGRAAGLQQICRELRVRLGRGDRSVPHGLVLVPGGDLRAARGGAARHGVRRQAAARRVAAGAADRVPPARDGVPGRGGVPRALCHDAPTARPGVPLPRHHHGHPVRGDPGLCTDVARCGGSAALARVAREANHPAVRCSARTWCSKLSPGCSF